jgi:hypothetical protein
MFLKTQLSTCYSNLWRTPHLEFSAWCVPALNVPQVGQGVLLVYQGCWTEHSSWAAPQAKCHTHICQDFSFMSGGPCCTSGQYMRMKHPRGILYRHRRPVSWEQFDYQYRRLGNPLETSCVLFKTLGSTAAATMLLIGSRTHQSITNPGRQTAWLPSKGSSMSISSRGD